VLRVRQNPGALEHEVDAVVFAAALVVLWAVARDRHQADRRGIADLRAEQAGIAIVGDPYAAIGEFHKAARVGGSLRQRSLAEARCEVGDVGQRALADSRRHRLFRALRGSRGGVERFLADQSLGIILRPRLTSAISVQCVGEDGGNAGPVVTAGMPIGNEGSGNHLLVVAELRFEVLVGVGDQLVHRRELRVGADRLLVGLRCLGAIERWPGRLLGIGRTDKRPQYRAGSGGETESDNFQHETSQPDHARHSP
jgi:hypothetical protein